MGAAMGGDDDEGITAINVTPFVDVMLVLLVIFLVASVYIVKESIEVELPKAATATETTDLTLSLVLDRDNKLYLNGNPSSESEIATACQQAAAKNPNAQAIIAADEGARHGRVVRLIDLIRINGLTKFAINVKPPKDAVPN
jgi:biopolymer transport protein TolR